MSPGIAFQFWLTDGDRRILGEEDARLLAAISRLGSLESVAMELSIGVEDVREALARIRDDCGKKIAGGPETRCHLTEYGKALLDEFSNKRRRAAEQLANAFRNPAPAADGIVLVDGRIVLIRRGREPEKGKYALPGGFVEHGERVEECVVREVREETGLRTEPLELMGVYSDPSRDPRGHILSMVFRMRVLGGELGAGDDAEGASLFDLDALPELAFDHARIIADYLKASGRGR
jgi:8-oxo-dGTP diphosphatase